MKCLAARPPACEPELGCVARQAADTCHESRKFRGGPARRTPLQVPAPEDTAEHRSRVTGPRAYRLTQVHAAVFGQDARESVQPSLWRRKVMEHANRVCVCVCVCECVCVWVWVGVGGLVGG